MSVSKLCILVLILAHVAKHRIALHIFENVTDSIFLLPYNKLSQHSVTQQNDKFFASGFAIWQNSVGERSFCPMKHQLG